MNITIIKDSVQYYFNIFLDTKSRRTEYVYARCIYYKLCKEFTTASLHKIGNQVNRNHATVIHGLKVFDNVIDNPTYYECIKEYFHIYEDLKKHIKNKMSLEIKKRDPNNYYKEKYRIKLLQNKNLYNFTKDIILKLEQMDFKYSNILKDKLNLIANDKRYKHKRKSK